MSWRSYSPYNSPPPSPPSLENIFLDSPTPFNPSPIPPEFEPTPLPYSVADNENRHRDHTHSTHHYYEDNPDEHEEDFQVEEYQEFRREHRHRRSHRREHRSEGRRSTSRSHGYTDISELEHLPEIEMPSFRQRPISYPANFGSEPSVTGLNRLSVHTAQSLMYACLPDAGFAQEMVASRPFENIDAVYEASRMKWNNIADRWRETFRKHDAVARIPPGDGVLGSWIRKESADMKLGFGGDLKREIREIEARYRRKHGFPFVTCLEGKAVNDVLEELKERLENETEIEVFEAASEQVNITNSRLNRALIEARAM